MYKKLKFYFVILSVLWIGAFTQVMAEAKFHYNSFIDAYTEKTTSLLQEKEYNEKLTFAEGRECAKQFLNQYHGVLVKEVKGDNFYSFYGYSDLLHSNVVIENQKINLNIVFTYNEKEGKTIVKVVTPFLNEDY
ncbi:YwmB family TATA-box binding protein [Velocimicrobium porci]|nr:YwmB family TATA-box binding protein [Velocimicrobium porci]